MTILLHFTHIEKENDHIFRTAWSWGLIFWDFSYIIGTYKWYQTERKVRRKG